MTDVPKRGGPTTTPTTTPAIPDPQGDVAQPGVVPDSNVEPVDFMSLIDDPPGDYTEAQLRRVLASIEQMDKQFGTLMANNRTLRERVVARLNAKSKPGTVIDIKSREKLGDGR